MAIQVENLTGKSDISVEDRKILGWYVGSKVMKIDGELTIVNIEVKTSKYAYQRALRSKAIPRDANGNFVPFTPYSKEELKEIAALNAKGKNTVRYAKVDSTPRAQETIDNLKTENEKKELLLQEKSKEIEEMKAKLAKFSAVKKEVTPKEVTKKDLTEVDLEKK